MADDSLLADDEVRLVLERIPHIVWMSSADGATEYMNQQGVTLLELTGSPMRGWWWLPFLHPDDVARARAAWQAAVDAVQAYRVEYRVRQPDGTYRWFLSQAVPVDVPGGGAKTWVGTWTDIDDRKHAESQLTHMNGRLRALSERLHLAREEEATRISRELHDELGSVLTRLRWDIAQLGTMEPGAGDARATAAAALALVDSIFASVRRIASQLRPSVLDDLGLLAALQWLARDCAQHGNISCHFDSSVEDVSLDAQRATTIFRVVQEALTNVQRHAAATTVTVSVHRDGGALVVTVADDGRGIPAEAAEGTISLGLLGMRARAALIGGTIEVRGTPGAGTVLTLRVPEASG
jgi:two-component system sensor histidine kinase UhpB